MRSPNGSALSACAPRPIRCSTTASGERAPACANSRALDLTATDVLEAVDRDLELVLRARVDGGHLTLDFTGSAVQDPGNLNCPMAVTESACLFALRVLTDPGIPPTAGTQRALTVIAPAGSLLNARRPAAVAAGNVETSSRVADLVLTAFGRAQGQGTMNNLTLGDESFTYYETLGGGQARERRTPTVRARSTSR